MSSSTKQKKKHIKAVRPKLRLFRANDPLYSVLMWGINHSISELSHVNMPVMLMPDDFKAYSKTQVDNHMFNKDNMPSHFKFKDYCPIVFRNLRERFGFDDEAFLNSLTKECPVDTEQSASRASVGGRLLVSFDKRFFIKTIQSEQVAEMHRILKEYHQYIVERHADTLLPQYLGMYRVTINDSRSYHLIMRHVFSPRLKVHRKYDLKGSMVTRQASNKERNKNLPTLKDSDFINEGRIIQIGAERREKLVKTLQSDSEFLAGLNLMDYSLLVGIHDCDRPDDTLTEQNDSSFDRGGGEDEDDEEEDESSPCSGGDNAPPSSAAGGPGATNPPTPPDSPVTASYRPPAFSGELDPTMEFFALKCSEQCPRREIYFVALIDILSHYGVKKQAAQAAKTVKHGSSTVNPEQYSRRFLEFVDRILE